MLLTSQRFVQRQLTSPLLKCLRTSAVTFNLPDTVGGGGDSTNDRNLDENKQNAKLLARQQMIQQQRQKEDNFTPFRYVYPEFLPDPTIEWRNRVREKLERIDMLKRRSNLDVPEFYVGTIMSVTVSDWNAPGKANTFVGICTERGGCGLRAWFVLRNAIDGQGVEILYDMYNPTIQSIVVLRLEKRLDECLRYLRDCPIEYSTFPFDMPIEVRSADAPVPVNPLKIKLKPKPWVAKWQHWDLKGVEDFSDQIEEWERRRRVIHKFHTNTDHDKYDLMKTYKSTIPAEDQAEIFGEVHPQLAKLTQTLRSQKKRRAFARPQKQA